MTELHPKYEHEDVVTDGELPIELPPLASVVHDLHVTLELGGPDWSLTCPNGPGSACHTYIDEATGQRIEDDECVILPWWRDDTAGAMDGYAGETRDSIVSGPIVVLACNEDEFAWEYAPTPTEGAR